MNDSNWIKTIAALLPFVSNGLLRNALSTVLVAALGLGGFAGAYFGLGSRPVQVDEVSLNEATVRAIAAEAVNGATADLGEIQELARTNARGLADAGQRLQRTEELQLENTRILNRVLGRIDVLLKDVQD